MKRLPMKVMLLAMLLAAGASGAPSDRLASFVPAPGRTDGRVYYFVPKAVDTSRRNALLVFLHGGDASSPDSAPEKYFGEGGWAMPVFEEAPFIVVAPSAPPAADGSRWNHVGVAKMIEATIEDAKRRFDIDPDRVFLGGHSMGGFGAYHLGQVLADRLAGVWASAGAWWEVDFRAFLGTPVYIQHGSLDCSPRPGYAGGHSHPRCHHWCGVSFARAAHELMTRDGVDHVYEEHGGGHSLRFPEAVESTRRFFAWSRERRRDPFARRIALVTPCGSAHPDVEPLRRTRWLELLEAGDGDIDVDRIVLKGPDIARTDDDLALQTYELVTMHRDGGARIVAENLGGNRFRVETRNVRRFRILLAPAMGDLARSFTVALGDGCTVEASARPLAGERDYTAYLELELVDLSKRNDK